MKRLAWVLIAAASAVPLAGATGCQRIEATGERAFILLSWEQEIDLGRQAAPELEQEFGGRHEDLALQAYVRTVGQRVARASHKPDLPYEFTVLKSDVINAFALPGGPVYITQALLKQMKSEGELAAVLGHEVAHVTARHASRQISRQMGFEILLAAAQAAATRGKGGGETLKQAEALVKVIGGLIRLRYSRGMESQADTIGLDYLAAAGYHPGEMVRLLTVFVEMEGDRPPELLSTHPNPENRVGSVRDIINEKYPGRGGTVGEDEYRRQVLDRLK